MTEGGADGLRSLSRDAALGGLIRGAFLCSDLRPEIPVETVGWTYPGCIACRPEALAGHLAVAGLTGRRLPWYHPRQTWYAIAARAVDLPPADQDRHLGGAVLRDPEFSASLEVDV